MIMIKRQRTPVLQVVPATALGEKVGPRIDLGKIYQRIKSNTDKPLRKPGRLDRVDTHLYQLLCTVLWLAPLRITENMELLKKDILHTCPLSQRPYSCLFQRLLLRHKPSRQSQPVQSLHL